MDRGTGKRGKQTAGVDVRKIAISKSPMKFRVEGNEATPSKIEKPKNDRSYEGYLLLEKIFSVYYDRHDQELD